MAWNVVIAGGGFGGAAAARELERVMPRQSARLQLVNETNFMLYTPFLPEAAAGTLEPRHVVTPLRDILKRTYLRLGSIVGHDPEAKTVTLAPKHGMVVSMVYYLFVDMPLGLIPASISELSIQHHVRSILMRGESLESGPVIGLIVFAVLGLAIALWRVRRLE